MDTQESQFTKSDQIHKHLSEAEINKLAQSGKSTSQRGILPKTNNSIKGNGVDRRLTQRNNTAAHSEVSVEFAAKQLFQILLVDIKYRNAKLNNNLEIVPVPFAGIQRKINI